MRRATTTRGFGHFRRQWARLRSLCHCCIAMTDLASLIHDADARPLAFVDLETTGGRPGLDRITEVGVIEVDRDGVRRWSTLVDPLQPIPPFVQQLTGITDAMVRGAPTFDALAAELARRLDGKLFIAHNARFDHGFLKKAFEQIGIRFDPDVLCTVRLSRALFPRESRHGLDALAQRLDLSACGRHRALADADLVWQFWQRVHALHPRPAIEAALRRLIRGGGGRRDDRCVAGRFGRLRIVRQRRRAVVCRQERQAAATRAYAVVWRAPLEPRCATGRACA
ncbi:Exonuclease family protein [Mycetohabitans rhizoxinica HKI 454]|uniref:DNA-directed DNA polymerase n=1 Tax=Mycetohabitans rhizoxinica (strain DSM 19002 / CIP 109453 / HKI 454) TaxID=882378 RepID=E5ANK9_MYCRK|nr:Exonuclease family protein [Mycetohabitans rhizoxinica HKI 454]